MIIYSQIFLNCVPLMELIVYVVIYSVLSHHFYITYKGFSAQLLANFDIKKITDQIYTNIMITDCLW